MHTRRQQRDTHVWPVVIATAAVLGACTAHLPPATPYRWDIRIPRKGAGQATNILLRQHQDQDETAELVSRKLKELLATWSSRFGVTPVGQTTGEYSWEKQYTIDKEPPSTLIFRYFWDGEDVSFSGILADDSLEWNLVALPPTWRKRIGLDWLACRVSRLADTTDSGDIDNLEAAYRTCDRKPD